MMAQPSAPPRLPSGGSKESSGAASSGTNSSRSRQRSASIGERVSFCVDKLKRAVKPRSRSREVSPVTVPVRPHSERCWEEHEADSPERRKLAASCEEMPACFRRSNSLAALLQEEADSSAAPGRCSGTSEPPLCAAYPGAIDAAPRASSSADDASVARPKGGISIDVDFCSTNQKSKAPPAAVLARLNRSGSDKRSSEVPSSGTEAGANFNDEMTRSQGGVSLDINACESSSKPKKPPSGFAARLSQRPPAKLAKEQSADTHKHTHVGSVSSFFAAPDATAFLAQHDVIELYESVRSHRLTTRHVQSLCADLKSLNGEGVAALLSWRMALRHERTTGKLPSQDEVAALCEIEAQQYIQASFVAGRSSSSSATTQQRAGPNVISKPADNVLQQASGVNAAMAATVEARAGDEDKEVLAQIQSDIDRLTQALKEPGVTNAQAYAIRKQLGAKRSDKARAERAIRQGRKAKLEVAGGDAAVQAIVDSLPTAARGSRNPRAECPPEQAVPLRSLHETEEERPVAPPKRAFGFIARVHSSDQGSRALRLSVLLQPETLLACGWRVLGPIGCLSKEFKSIALDSTDVGYGETAWRCASQSFAHEYALWCPEPMKIGQQGYWHKLMLEQLWPARKKWESTAAAEPRRLGELGTRSEQQAAQDFKIQVAVRFKPGSVNQSRLLVPLHQKLLLLRKSGDDVGSKIGKKEPPEFLDALMGHLMTDPVLLPSSRNICDRRVVQDQLKHQGNRDPFDGSPLTCDMLQPQDDLRARIVEWRAESKKRLDGGRNEHKLDEDEVRELISEMGGDIDPEIVEMLLEADRLRAAGKRALQDSTMRRRTREDNEIEDDAAVEEGEDAEGRAWWDQDTQALGAARTEMPNVGPRVINSHGMKDECEEELGEAPTREGPKVLAVSPPTRIVMFQPGAGIRPFIFGRVFDDEATQADVYEHTARNSVCAALNGFNACLLCYGQTGAGKTHTMFGQTVACGGNAGAVVSQQSGSVMRSLRELFNAASELQASCEVTTRISAQYVQIYQDQVACLVTGGAVSLREVVAGAPVLLQGAAETHLESLVDASQLIAGGEELKRYAETAMNHRSSRAHTVLAIKLTQHRGDLETTSQLHLVDLAGSERVKKSRAQGGRLVEAVGINSSLMVLGQCIAARVEDRSHVPYYESRLTLLLRSALGGNSRTAVVICCHKDDKHGDETLQAISFGERCAMVSNRVHAAVASSATAAAAAIDAALAECSTQIQGLEARGKGHLPACDKLRKRHATLLSRRRELEDRLPK